ncbi:MAG: hypothetical protein AAF447_11410 [Myxococcota bacterium]
MDRDPAKLEAELARLRGHLAALKSDWERLRYTPALVLLAVPAFFVAGPLGAALTLLLVLSLIATAAYLIGVRRREYAGEIAEVKRELTLSRPPSASAVDGSR